MRTPVPTSVSSTFRGLLFDIRSSFSIVVTIIAAMGEEAAISVKEAPKA